ncbi:hypothetical protein CPC08DRAFT_763172 [Agrocybe pediades]|nr:hypothetical protein CPC08DRAFT_763172 [Agrocybe pediades]
MAIRLTPWRLHSSQQPPRVFGVTKIPLGTQTTNHPSIVVFVVDWTICDSRSMLHLAKRNCSSHACFEALVGGSAAGLARPILDGVQRQLLGQATKKRPRLIDKQDDFPCVSTRKGGRTKEGKVDDSPVTSPAWLADDAQLRVVLALLWSAG